MYAARLGTACRAARAPSTFCAEDTWAGSVGRRMAGDLFWRGRRSRRAGRHVSSSETTSADSGANRKGARSRTPTSPTLALLPFSGPKEKWHLHPPRAARATPWSD